jgi:hypothetical protein
MQMHPTNRTGVSNRRVVDAAVYAVAQSAQAQQSRFQGAIAACWVAAVVLTAFLMR